MNAENLTGAGAGGEEISSSSSSSSSDVSLPSPPTALELCLTTSATSIPKGRQACPKCNMLQQWYCPRCLLRIPFVSTSSNSNSADFGFILSSSGSAASTSSTASASSSSSSSNAGTTTDSMATDSTSSSSVPLLPPLQPPVIPEIRLPIRVEILRGRDENCKKSTAAHVAVLAPQDTKVWYLPDFPHFEDPSRVLLLYPSPTSLPLSSLDQSKYDAVMVVDTTWTQVGGVLQSKEISNMPFQHVHLSSYNTLFWRYQALGPQCLSTAEALYYFFREWEEARVEKLMRGGDQRRSAAADAGFSSYYTPLSVSMPLSSFPPSAIPYISSRFNHYDGRYDNLLVFFLAQYYRVQSEYIQGGSKSGKSFCRKMRAGYIRGAAAEGGDDDGREGEEGGGGGKQKKMSKTGSTGDDDDDDGGGGGGGGGDDGDDKKNQDKNDDNHEQHHQASDAAGEQRQRGFELNAEPTKGDEEGDEASSIHPLSRNNSTSSKKQKRLKPKYQETKRFRSVWTVRADLLATNVAGKVIKVSEGVLGLKTVESTAAASVGSTTTTSLSSSLLSSMDARAAIPRTEGSSSEGDISGLGALPNNKSVASPYSAVSPAASAVFTTSKSNITMNTQTALDMQAKMFSMLQNHQSMDYMVRPKGRRAKERGGTGGGSSGAAINDESALKEEGEEEE